MMTTPTTHEFAPSRGMGLYEVSMWEEDSFDGHNMISPAGAGIGAGTGTGTGVGVCIFQTDKSLEHVHQDCYPSRRSISEKIQRRLAQNREAARKSRLRKKAYVHQLETSRLKLAQLEVELERTREQGLLNIARTNANNVGLCGTVNSAGIGAFETEYGQWIEEQERNMSDLRNALQSPIGHDIELRMMVENILNHYCNVFRMKRDAASVDAFYLLSGMWRTSVERFFLWIGGFRPSELITVVMPQLGPLNEQKIANVGNLKQFCLQAEDALSQGMERLQQTLAQTIAFPAGNYSSHHMASALDKLESLKSFVNQADHIREQTLQQMSRILTTRQAAKGLLAFGQYFQSLRALSSLWSARSPHKLF